ncbi:ABC transporter ATP-binding protein [Clostridium putrefaciens]|nr:ABC transporter ATP-binding protein [Clostridium putrefaciens]
MNYIKLHKLKFFLYLLITSFLIMLGLISPYLESIFIDGLIYTPNYNFLFKITVTILVVSLVSTIFAYFQNILLLELNTKISFQLSNDIINHLKKVSVLYLEQYDSAYLSNRINTDCNTIIPFFLSNVIKIFSNLFIMLFCFIWLTVHYGLSLILLISCILPMYILLYISLKKPLYNRNLDLLEKQSGFFATLNRIFRNLKNIKTKVLFTETEDLYKSSFSSLFKSIISFNKISYVFFSLNNLCNSFLHILIIIFVGIKIIKGEVTLGEFTLISSYSSMIVSSINYYLSLGEDYQVSKASYLRLKEFINIDIEINDIEIINSIDNITITDLSFFYNADENLINKFSYTFKKGFTYALTGCNGAGKSTLIDLILGVLNENYSGDICYNGVNIKSLDMYTIRKNLTFIVEQDPYLSMDTIYNNLTSNIKTINCDSINYLLQVFHLQKAIDSFPNGIETIINDNIKNLSGGERQKISIINSILSQADLIILDEPTSALDISSSTNLKSILNQLKFNKIIIIVSHDEDFYNICDYIIKL